MALSILYVENEPFFAYAEEVYNSSIERPICMGKCALDKKKRGYQEPLVLKPGFFIRVSYRYAG